MALVHYCDNRNAFEMATTSLEQTRRTIEGHLATQRAMQGYCFACDAVTAFSIGPANSDGWANLRELIMCAGCGLSGRMRLAYSAMRGVLAKFGASAAHIMEQTTPLYAALQRDFPELQGSEYVDARCLPGSIHPIHGADVRHEDMHRLSYGDESLDVFAHFDVLEHVADYRTAIAECARVLRPAGRLLFTVPFFGQPKHLICAEFIDGALVHHQPPSYHSNPVSEKGSLVYFVPGWPLLDELRELGFASAQIGLCYDPFQGIVSDNNPYPEGLMWPVIFRATKRS